MVNRDAVAALIVTAGTGLAVGVAKLVPWYVERTFQLSTRAHTHRAID